jgi:transcriptional regulator with XRE-family HTH domain
VPETEAHKVVKELIELLKKRRESLGWSQRTLAEQAGVDPKTVSLIEREMRSPTLFTLVLLATAMDWPLWKALKDVEMALETER